MFEPGDVVRRPQAGYIAKVVTKVEEGVVWGYNLWPAGGLVLGDYEQWDSSPKGADIGDLVPHPDPAPILASFAAWRLRGGGQ